MQFWKYEGLGNDFIVVAGDPDDYGPLAERLCDRHFGVGADGVLVVSEAQGAAGRMTVFNADGSRPEMCGNGVRCVARYLVDQRGAPEAFVVQTDAGPMQVRVLGADIEVRVARPRVVGELSVTVADEPVTGVHVDAGNPHLVLFDPPADADPARDGAALQGVLPSGVNVSFARVVGPTAVELVVYERGVGLTLACGTAAYSTVTAGWAAGRLRGAVEVRLPGGFLVIDEADEGVVMCGGARHVFSGVWAG